jgi:group II intron reverse transcriptase/maturase
VKAIVVNTNGVTPVEREGTQVYPPEVNLGSPDMGDNALERLEALRKVNGNPNWVNQDLYRLMYKPSLYVIAYERIKSSPGNMTPGTDKQTLDGFSRNTIERIVGELKGEAFQFARARRVLIPKANGGTRPLGVASPLDKVVQEAIRIILECIYDSPYGSSFSEYSFGFRSGIGTHSALQHISQNWAGTTWFVEGDIKGCFDNIDHHRLIEILALRIKDKRFLNLIWKALTAGYLEFKVPVNNVVGTPQGSIISPILANIYMHELDMHVEGLRRKYETASKTKYARAYADNMNALRRERRALAKLKADDTIEKERITKEILRLKVVATTMPVWDPETLPIRIKYVRYADDWLIGLAGSKGIAQVLKDEIELFLADRLKLTLSREKTHIRHAKTEEAVFLGTRIRVGSKTPRVLTYARKLADSEEHYFVTKRTTMGRVIMFAPVDKIVSRLHQKGFCDVNGLPISKPSFAVLDELKIIEEYNAVLLGYLNYYSFVANRHALRRIAYILQFSAAKTLANKHRTSMRKIFRKHGGHLFVSVVNPSGKVKATNLKYPLVWKAQTNRFLTKARPSALEVFTVQNKLRTRTKIDEHCCICASVDRVSMHHLKHVRKGGETLKGFDAIMARLNRKQLPACHNCHVEIHSGRYDGKSLRDFADPHLAAR